MGTPGSRGCTTQLDVRGGDSDCYVAWCTYTYWPYQPSPRSQAKEGIPYPCFCGRPASRRSQESGRPRRRRSRACRRCLFFCLASLFAAEDRSQVAEGKHNNCTTILCTPSLIRSISSKLGRILGPRGLMPSERRGTVTDDIEGYVQRLQGTTEWRGDKTGTIRMPIGKVSYLLLLVPGLIPVQTLSCISLSRI